MLCYHQLIIKFKSKELQKWHESSDSIFLDLDFALSSSFSNLKSFEQEIIRNQNRIIDTVFLVTLRKLTLNISKQILVNQISMN